MRYDKYDPVSGGFRAPLAANWAGSPLAIGVGLDVNGRVVPGTGNTGVIGVLCKPSKANAGDVVDVMTHGEIVEAGLVAGTLYGADAGTGEISDGSPAVVGFTVEASRLIVRINIA